MVNLLTLSVLSSIGMAAMTDNIPVPEGIFGYLVRFGLEGLFIGFAAFCLWQLLNFLTKVFIPRLDALIENQNKIADKLHKLTESLVILPCMKKEDEE